MILHYLKITFRKLGKNYIFASINIGGLVIALACAFLIFHFVLSELSTDRFHKNGDDIYKTIVSFTGGHDGGMSFYGSSYIFAENISDRFPEIIDVTRLHSLDFNNGGQYILQNEEPVKALNFIAVDASFFSIFSIDILNGSTKDLLPDISSLLLSKSMSEKFFPNENPLGKNFKG
jgi:putative ABC transport system permease protein